MRVRMHFDKSPRFLVQYRLIFRRTRPMTDDLERLEALAMAATPGPWEWKDRDGWYELEDQEGYRIADDGTACGEYGGWMELPTEPNAAFIAAANPAAILSLIQRVREADRLLKIENGIRALAQQNFENMKQYSEDAYDNGRKAGHAAGRAEALEEAAKVAERVGLCEFDAGPPDDGKWFSGMVQIDNTPTRDQTAKSIRALGEKQ